jgi:hypothetical protein
MKICQMHWDKLRAAIEDRGLMQFVAKSGEKAAKQIVQQLEGDNSNSTYDPLMAANFAIWSNALAAFGIGMMNADAPCPLCLMDDHKKTCTKPGCEAQGGDDWIRFAADGQLEEARERGLVPKAS